MGPHTALQAADSQVSTMIGLVAGTLTTVSFVPQVFRCWRRRSAEDLSLAMLLAFTAGVALWDVYGLMLRAWPIILANGITLLLAMVLVAMKVGFREHRDDRGAHTHGSLF